MSKTLVALGSFVSLPWLLVSSASAHHGFGNFAMNEDIEVAGVVTSIDFVNPHSWVHFDVTAADGTKPPVEPAIPGTFQWSPADSHAAKNVGNTRAEALYIELKN